MKFLNFHSTMKKASVFNRPYSLHVYFPISDPYSTNTLEHPLPGDEALVVENSLNQCFYSKVYCSLNQSLLCYKRPHTDPNTLPYRPYHDAERTLELQQHFFRTSSAQSNNARYCAFVYATRTQTRKIRQVECSKARPLLQYRRDFH